ncbi:MAG TPA: FctA domain-containing protein, partial [Oscillospiraceae bacterium]|nr:FctA domain-containing protein [Oscillospiraceae bacterium]
IDGVYTVSVTGAGSTSFPAISYDRVGSYTYTLYQEPGENDKAVYDDTVYLLTVYVTNQENGTGLDTQWVLRLPQTEDKQEAEFTNFYEAVLPVTPPLIQLEKLAKESSFANAGDLIHYYFIVTNDGMVPVVKLIVNDPKLGIDNLIIDLKQDPLMPGETYTYEFSQAYVVTQADVEAGKVDNTLTVKGENEEELAYEATDDLTITREQILPHIPKTGESRTYWTGIAALMLGGAVALILINRRRNLKIQETDQE